jgi:hypothetical protein
LGTGNYDRTGTIANAESTATDGNPGPIWAVGFGGDSGAANPNGSGAVGDELWNAFNAVQDPTLGKTIAAGTGIGTFNVRSRGSRHRMHRGDAQALALIAGGRPRLSQAARAVALRPAWFRCRGCPGSV